MIKTDSKRPLDLDGPFRVRLDYQTDGQHQHADLSAIAGLVIVFGEHGEQPDGSEGHPGFGYLIGCPHNSLAIAVVAIRLLRAAGYHVPAMLYEAMGVTPPRCPQDGSSPRCAAPAKPD